MKVYDAVHIKNIAVVGHGGDGKTTLVESMLFSAGVTERRGRVEDGNTVTDYDPEETKRHISLMTALAPLEWQGNKLNLIDAPGFFDFVGETTQAYYLADSALILANAVSGVGVGAETAYKYCKKHGKPMAFVVNQMDKEHTDFTKVLDQLKDEFGPSITAAMLPIVQGEVYKGYIDVITGKAYEFGAKGASEIAVPDDMADVLEEAREALIENAASNDEELMEKFFGGEDLSKEDIIKGLSLGIAQANVIPVFATSATQGLGVEALLDALSAYMPAAADIPAVHARNEAGDDLEIERDPAGAFAAQVMKTIADPFVGKINIFKVLRGELKSDTQLFNVNSGKAEKFGNISIMRGKKIENVDKLCTGDIGALAKLQFTKTGDSLCASNAKVIFDEIEFGEPCISLAVTAKKQGDEEKVFAGLHRLEEEDPTFRVGKNTETGDTLLMGMGEMHIEVICQKLKNKFGVEAALSDPKVAYRETIRKTAEAEGKHKKQSGGAGQFGVVQIRFEPSNSGDFEFVNAIVGGVVPKEYIPAVEKGLKESMVHGVLAGYPMVGIKATLFDGKYHPVDSKEVAFKSAARLAYKAACAKANPVLLEPIGKAEVIIPDQYMGEIIGDMNRRRGRILGMNPCEDGQQVVAEVPMSEMVKYATDLRSMTQGRGTFSITFERYDEMPAQMAQKVIDKAKLDSDDE